MSTVETEHMPSAERLRELLMGRKVVRAEIRDETPPDEYRADSVGYLTLDDGTVLKVWGNDGGCACSAGCYPLTTLNDCDNIITNVEVEEHPDDDDVKCPECGERYCWKHENEGYYRIFVYAEDRKINLASFEGSDGNGYYGTGWWLAVARTPPGETQ